MTPTGSIYDRMRDRPDAEGPILDDYVRVVQRDAGSGKLTELQTALMLAVPQGATDFYRRWLKWETPKRGANGKVLAGKLGVAESTVSTYFNSAVSDLWLSVVFGADLLYPKSVAFAPSLISACRVAGLCRAVAVARHGLLQLREPQPGVPCPKDKPHEFARHVASLAHHDSAIEPRPIEFLCLNRMYRRLGWQRTEGEANLELFCRSSVLAPAVQHALALAADLPAHLRDPVDQLAREVSGWRIAEFRALDQSWGLHYLVARFAFIHHSATRRVRT